MVEHARQVFLAAGSDQVEIADPRLWRGGYRPTVPHSAVISAASRAAARKSSARGECRAAAIVESLGLRPLDVGGLVMAHWLEGMGLLTVALANHGMTNWDFALGVDEFAR